MTSKVVTIDVNASLEKARDLFKKNKIRHLPVTDNELVIGILSQTDLLRLSFGNTYVDDDMVGEDGIMDELSINQIMKHKPDMVGPNDSIKEVAEKFISAEYHALPVEDNGKLVGIVTTTDVIRFLLSKS
ncbi:CBS domain-containing protein [Hyphobacterium sp. CCMP332]|nr:CBS domain-containing protein [Hyphobacterium sp. CCMP332]